VAPNGTIYIFHSSQNLWSFTPSGSKRWESDGLTGSNFPVIPTVSPDGSVIVFGTVFSFGVNGKLVAVKATDGSVRWELPITGPSAGAAGPVAFSADGQTVYAPVTEIGGVNKLLAVSVRGNSGGGIPCGDLVSFQVRCKSTGAGGHKLQARLILTDTSHSGEQVIMTVDGNPTPLVINGDRAQLTISNPELGGHTVALTDPAGCFPPATPSCE
jgi:outer membrane protein assembly factor BamB